MKISDLRVTRKKRISVYIDGEFAAVLHPDVFATSRLKVGAEVSPEQMTELLDESLFKMAKEEAISLLSYRAYTRKQLCERLCRKNFPPETARLAVERMEELGLVNDADYALRYACDLVNLKGLSRRMVREKLLLRGIDRDTAEETLAQIEFNDEEQIASIVLRKYRSRLGDEAAVEKTVNALVRMGFRYEEIRRVLRNLCEDEQYYTRTEVED